MNLDIWQLLGGIGLFLFAMTQVETSLKALGERSFTNLLRRGSEKPLQSVLGGVAATAMLQSSSIVGPRRSITKTCSRRPKSTAGSTVAVWSSRSPGSETAVTWPMRSPFG